MKSVGQFLKNNGERGNKHHVGNRFIHISL